MRSITGGNKKKSIVSSARAGAAGTFFFSFSTSPNRLPVASHAFCLCVCLSVIIFPCNCGCCSSYLYTKSSSSSSSSTSLSASLPYKLSSVTLQLGRLLCDACDYYLRWYFPIISTPPPLPFPPTDSPSLPPPPPNVFKMSNSVSTDRNLVRFDSHTSGRASSIPASQCSPPWRFSI